ncbi:MAG: GDP-mannose 4,6-dehydratase [Flavobacteriales bacterium]|nr:GDP-mannose 4,6-dehydratase [Flavobacteriales bacterium]MBK7271125.1 GDP-mannose 4,6-dehydratase [Flavobacteriales bacterium]MBK7754489.1 GDP-mannose 4,6-dehydratase [Flavobacteriales bacterium]MBP6699191.1 GDP-mannose 4,6-dehydratase [Flavobacteriales bacterium]
MAITPDTGSSARLKVLVTGGAGFIGSHLCEALLGAGHSVRCLDSFITGKRANIAHLDGRGKFTVLEGDIRDLEVCKKATQGMDAVLHLAALGSVPRSIDDPLASEAANLGGFLNLLEACRYARIRRFVYASSSSVYGDSPASPKREGQEGKPLSPYAVTKAMNEVYADLYHRLFVIESIGLRFFNVFGERQDPQGAYAAAIPRFVTSLLRHEPPEVHGDGHQTRDFTYVGNAVAAMLAGLHCTDERAFGHVFNIAYGQSTDVLQLIDRIKLELVKHDPQVATVPVNHIADRPGDVRASLADIGRAHDILGYRPAFDLSAGLQRAVPWYVANWG